MSGSIGGQTDSVLLPFLASSDEIEAEFRLVTLFTTHVLPINESVVRSSFNQPWGRRNGLETPETQDIEDVVGEANLAMLAKLRQLRKSSNGYYISDFCGYVAVAAHNACHLYWRRKRPNRTRLSGRLRYALEHHPDFSLWTGIDGILICGFSEWQCQDRPANWGWINQARMDPAKLMIDGPTRHLVDLIRSVFNSTNAPVYLQDLVSFAAEILGITDKPCNYGRLEDLDPDELGGKFVDPADIIGLRQYLDLVWDEILRLPLLQRASLLLGARDDGHTSAADLILELRIASISGLSKSVGMSADAFVPILPNLPMEDREIAARLKRTRQQVTSSRLTARRCLSRRLKSLSNNVAEGKSNGTSTLALSEPKRKRARSA